VFIAKDPMICEQLFPFKRKATLAGSWKAQLIQLTVLIQLVYEGRKRDEGRKKSSRKRGACRRMKVMTGKSEFCS